MGECSSPTQADLNEELESILQANIDAGAPGLSAAISASRGIVWQSTAGFANIESQESISKTHLFGIGSITKVFVTVIILQLIDEKLLKLSDIVNEFLDKSIFYKIENASTATIGGLLSHTAGVESWEDDPKWIVEGRGKELDTSWIWGKTDTLEYIRRPSSLTRGKYSYANTNFTLLGLIIEKITKHSAESEIRRRILEPLGLKDTFLEGFEECPRPESGRVPHRYHYATDKFRENAGICPSFSQHMWKKNSLIDATGSNLSVEWVAGGMVTSPSDLLKFVTSLRDGKLCSPASMKILKAWQPADGAEMGHGLFRIKSPSGMWLGHNGSVLGFTGAVWWKEDADCVVCVLANVGTMHCGDVPSSSAHVALNPRFLELATELAAYEA
ncbi:beta-lactamase/transpeptidase-like protein [Mollisia scopiformis]|uniref:Beta-lactamase/transpeptidase-like protein n=1 Tax=Mollisia scopiformis TaxID=149040 RepID=A0A132B449_MOLSC|nr:beta-lactamase/transpeptidase-like protein [Mollisia scopiformis]KUJ07166.1 beta-lactamase/transpeptidase-like protein [Mollisia scopiformis]